MNPQAWAADAFGEAVLQEVAAAAAIREEGRQREARGDCVFFWHEWTLVFQGPSRTRGGARATGVVRCVLAALGWWSKSWSGREWHEHFYADWTAARRRLRAAATRDQVVFYIDPNPTHRYPRYAHDVAARGDKLATCEGRGLFAKARAAIDQRLAEVGLFNATPPKMSAAAQLLDAQRTSGHWCPTTGLRCSNPGDDLDAQGVRIVEGQAAACYQRGRLFVGKAVYGLGSMWRIVAGEHVAYVCHREIFRPRPGLPRRFDAGARERLHGLMIKASGKEDYARAAVLKRARDRGHPALLEMLAAVDTRNATCTCCLNDLRTAPHKFSCEVWLVPRGRIRLPY